MILQFGAGNFMRAFADLFIDELNRNENSSPGPVIVVQSTGKQRAEALNQAKGRYHVAIQGFRKGEQVDNTVEVASIERALHAGSEWEQVLETATHPDLHTVLSNTTEAGFALDASDDSPDHNPPASFPAKLLAVLLARQQAGLPGVWIVPCELIEENGARLRELVLDQATTWGITGEQTQWLRNECRWINSLVDRIVPGPPKDHPLLQSDPLLLSAEPFAFWAVETNQRDFPFLDHPSVVASPDISPYSLRKVRILNGAHSALVSRAKDSHAKTVRDCVEDPDISTWLERLLFEEIVPVLEGRCEDPAGFAQETLDRFRNPFLDHQLSSIALHHETKIAVRLTPTRDEYRQRFGKEPELLSALLPAS